jgi:DsbC/DsbD-like thiol-disulfide interchange protein
MKTVSALWLALVLSFGLSALAARSASLAAFDGRCIPAGCVAPPSNTAGILGRRALPAGRLARLGATPDLHHGPLAAAPTETKHLTVEASSPAGAVAPGARVTLTLDVTPKPSMHVYAPGQVDYIPISLAVQSDPAVAASAVRFPKPEKLLLKALDESQLVYSKPFRIVQAITIADTPAVLARARTPGATVTVRGTLRYQACDDIICYVPVNVPVAWTITLKPPARILP